MCYKKGNFLPQLKSLAQVCIYMLDTQVKRFEHFLALFLLFICVVGGAQVPSGRLQHACVDLCWGRGAGYWRGGPHCMLRCSEESHPPGAANGTYWT